MAHNVLVALILGIIGIGLLAAGLATSIYTVSNTVRCEVCGQTMSKTDISAIEVVTSNGVTHWACSPMCAAELAIYYKNDTINAKCFVSERAIKINVVYGNYTSVSVYPSSSQDNVQVVEGANAINSPDMMSQMNAEKFVSTIACANQLLEKNYSSNPYAISINLQQVFVMGQHMLFMMPPTHYAVQIPTLDYALIIVGGGLFVVTPLSWKFLNNRNKS